MRRRATIAVSYTHLDVYKRQRQGLNDYTGWFAGDAQMGGDYYGYDGPYPPFNDLRGHRYFFRLFALDVGTLDLPARFTLSLIHI